MKYVWLIDDRVWAKVISEHAFHTQVKYVLYGVEYNELVENNSFMTPEELGIQYESYE